MKTTVSFTRSCTSAWASRWLLALVLAWTLLPAWAARNEGGVSLSQLSVDRQDDGLYLTAQLQLDLSSVMEEALSKGIAVYFVIEADTMRQRWYWSDQQVASARRYIRLSYQPLTRRWRLNTSSEPLSNSSLGMSLGQYHDSLSDALSAAQRISGWKVANVTDIEADSKYVVRFRFRLDASHLPRTLQIGATGQSEWALSLERRVDLPLEPAR